MQILTDRACDISPDQLKDLNIHFVPMQFTLDGKTYSSGVDISSAEFYDLLEKTDGYPTTSQPSAGEFADLYRKMAKEDPEILAILVSSGLSGTVASARAAAEMVPEARVTFWDTMTLSCPEAWQVEAAARALKAGWPLKQILQLLDRIRASCEGIYTLDTLRYLIHGGQISHLKGLVASVLQIRPVIGVDKEQGKYYTLGQERTEKRALQKITDVIARCYPEGTALRIQLLHGKNPAGLDALHGMLVSRFECHWTPTVSVAPILGAHTGKGVTGLSVGPADIFRELPGIVMS